MSRFVFSLLLVLYTQTSAALPFNGLNHSFELPGKWKITSGEEIGDVIAEQETANKRTFHVNENLAIYRGHTRHPYHEKTLRNAIKSTVKDRKEPVTELVEHTCGDDYYCAYQAMKGYSPGEFYIVTGVATNKGPVLVIYDGGGDTETGIQEIKAILETVQYHGRHNQKIEKEYGSSTYWMVVVAIVLYAFVRRLRTA